MTLWILIISILAIAFIYKAIAKIRRRRCTNYHIPEIKTRKKRTGFLRRFKYLEGIGD